MEEPLIKILKEDNDPICQRISIGGFSGEGLYCVYRYGPEGGKLSEIITTLETVLEELKKLDGR
jgi:hypothetical protein